LTKKYLLRRRFIVPGAIVFAMLGVGILNLQAVYAQSDTTYPTIVERLAEKFNLNKDEVQEVFLEMRDEHKANMMARWSEKLDSAIAAGDITESQKEAILDKHEEMEAKLESLKDLSPEDRHTQMQAVHEELRNWAEEQGIKVPFFMFKVHGPHDGGVKHDMLFERAM
jgi:hypothetical protein